MKKVPSIISSKDLTYIEDIFNWNFSACKKGIHYRSVATDDDVLKILDKIIEVNYNICEKLIKILD